ncbi:hypothetical protein B5M09_003495 [Aphanomyces astaci]|uniref:PPM-type phosphatase domain-containing protein n=1 Tax=Aphanomyces astaci TaxID=112090 RepID=A0A425D4K6_APHAT|nr:hypothetical protein B5M09_003495 [Aphanomyces astaci]
MPLWRSSRGILPVDDLGKTTSPIRERRRTFFRSNSFKSGVLIKPSTGSCEVPLHRQEVDVDDSDDGEPVVVVDDVDDRSVREPHVYVGGGIPGVAVDEFTIEQPKYTGHVVGGCHSVSRSIWWGARTRAGNDSMGRRKENQDSFCIRDRFANCDGLTFMCVLDGHGAQGAYVSHFVRDHYHVHVAAALRRHIPSLPPPPSSSPGDDVHHPESVDFNMFTLDTIEDVFLDASCRMTAALEDEMHLDISVSGTTAIALLFVTSGHAQPKVFVANVGDSRAVAGVVASNDPHEEARIVAANGRVFEYGVPRVWLQDVDMPGLAMSRSFGDSVATSVGVISDPQCSELLLTPGSFVIAASDGLWEFSPSTDVVAMCAKGVPYEDPQTTCDLLVAEALERWLDEQDVVDDITVVVVVVRGDDDRRQEEQL